MGTTQRRMLSTATQEDSLVEPPKEMPSNTAILQTGCYPAGPRGGVGHGLFARHLSGSLPNLDTARTHGEGNNLLLWRQPHHLREALLMGKIVNPTDHDVTSIKPVWPRVPPTGEYGPNSHNRHAGLEATLSVQRVYTYLGDSYQRSQQDALPAWVR